ncbi:hypothetical protein Q4508_06430 [Amphritea sp. 2_MG-2023]|uniref:hypothetical protein n=1 Tax=Amphritea TaxID=515417 RepID=UPI001C0714FF|nr:MULTISPECIES: hypothetical protein [Amphritea]MBU2966151.1 hypothetical protein [Amphritea atlantica]MDO6418194.1 hypothetical protein [Amphritea sp. 2_MG-2023]MDX2421949.1 hypothetical protein [Amphritea sp.]
MFIKKLSLAALVAASLVAPIAQADAGFGAGVTYVFGGGWAVGVKVFTDDEEDKAVGSLGLDYLVGSGAWRPNVGVGYLGENIYGDLSAGYNFDGGTWSFGVGAGAVDTDEDDDTASPAVPIPS